MAIRSCGVIGYQTTFLPSLNDVSIRPSLTLANPYYKASYIRHRHEKYWSINIRKTAVWFMYKTKRKYDKQQPTKITESHAPEIGQAVDIITYSLWTGTY